MRILGSLVCVFTILLSNYCYAVDDDKVENKSNVETEKNDNQLPSTATIDQNDFSARAQDKVLSLLQNLDQNLSKTNNLYQYFSGLVTYAIALDYTTAWVLGGHFKNLSKQQRERYSKLGRDYLIFAYGNMLNFYYKQYTFEIKNVVRRSARNYEVNVDIRKKNSKSKKSSSSATDDAISSVWVLSYSAKASNFYILDMVINNISLLNVQRAAFSDQLNKLNNKYDRFLDQLENKVKDLKNKGFSN